MRGAVETGGVDGDGGGLGDLERGIRKLRSLLNVATITEGAKGS